jgi:2-oxoglutarate dehydrogenase E2 component (dihydrolipoamide succinyltransferase)
VLARDLPAVIFTGASADPDGIPDDPDHAVHGMIPIKVPPLGESIVEATVSRWLKQDGERVASGETIVELETDKVTVEVPATTGGTLVRRLHQEGDVVGVGDILAEISQSAATPMSTAAVPEPVRRRPTPLGTPTIPPPAPAAPSRTQAPATPGSAAAPPPAPAPPPSAPRQPPAPARPAAPDPSVPPQPAAAAPSAPPPTASDVRASPAARRIATEQDLNLAEIPGTGRGGVVSKPDVIEHLDRSAAPAPAAQPAGTRAPTPEPAAPVAEEPAKAPAPAPEHAAPSEESAGTPAPTAEPRGDRDGPRETREKMSTRRRRIAEHLLESQHATAHLTTFNEIDMSAVEAFRGRVKERIEKETGLRLSFMPFFVRAACMALRQYPTVNASVDGDHIVHHHYVHMGIAVASDAGLVVPNIKDADRKGLVQIGRDIVTVAKKARDGKLVMDDLTGGTFTITNGGVFGSLLSTPIINFPQSGILGLHKMQDRPVAIDGRVEVRPMMYVALSYDHRIIDGQQAVLFLVRVKELIEDPALLAID